MQTFMIEKLRVSGAGKIDGVVEFADGLNLIQGRSNTGKTWILRCINYLFGNLVWLDDENNLNNHH